MNREDLERRYSDYRPDELEATIPGLQDNIASNKRFLSRYGDSDMPYIEAMKQQSEQWKVELEIVQARLTE